MSELFVEEEVRTALALLAGPKGVFEIRAIKAQLRGSPQVGPISGYFDNAQACVTRLSELHKATGIYITLNPVKPALLARCVNRLSYAERDSTTKDHHIQERKWLLLDVDPERPSGISASDEGKAAAKYKAREIYGYLKGRGWPKPVITDSGNGYHLVYLLDHPPLESKLFEQGTNLALGVPVVA